MDFNLDERTVALGVGELAGFAIGPRDAGDGPSGVWRAQLGTRWHQELRAQTAATTAAAEFEAAIAGQIFHGGWTLTLTGRIDQVLPAEEAGGPELLREIKTVLRPLPVSEEELRADYPHYFAQLAAYVALRRLAAPEQPVRAELLFVEAGSGLGQTVGLTPADDGLFRARLAAVTEFLTLRLRARERLRALRFRPAFTALRAGQETACSDLASALASAPGVLFEAPTGFGKTGVLLECALAQLRAGRFSRLLYLTSKSTGQLHVVQTLAAMTAVPDGAAEISEVGGALAAQRGRSKTAPLQPKRGAASAPPAAASENRELKTVNAAAQGVAAWHVRNKREHCINPVFHCTRDACVHLADLEARWPRSGLARFYLVENQPRDLETLRAAGREARLCPYEITRAALAFNDVWVGDYNYVFAPGSRGIFYDQPGFDPAATLLLIDEAHNLPARVADAHSHAVLADDLRALLAELEHQSASRPLQRAVEALARLTAALRPCDALDPAQEDDLADALATVAAQIAALPPDHAALGPHFAELLWQLPALDTWRREGDFPRLLWSPRSGELRFTCLDASALIGEAVRAYGGVVFATATPGPPEIFAAACGLTGSNVERDVPARFGPTKRVGDVALHPQTSALGIDNAFSLACVTARTPWRDGAYDIAYDVRVDTTFRQRVRHHATTAATIAALCEAAARKSGLQLSSFSSVSKTTPCVAVFFPSYAYVEAIQRELDKAHPALRAIRQPKLADLAAQTAWVEESLALADALFLVLGSSFAEGIDLLGGRITHAMVVGPALPEVNAVQTARLATLERAGLTREAAFARTYLVPGMQRVNQALGRLVRAPGQRAKVLLHCRRFIEPAYARVLDHDYQFGATMHNVVELTRWLAG